MKKNSNLIWIDLEMTGLNPAKDRVLEIATLVTDKNLQILAEGPVMAIHQMPHILDSMDEWNTKHHGESGLIERVRHSYYNEAKAEAETIAFLKNYINPNKSPMCGNSICQDRRFLFRWMPQLEDYFHYRNLDVSSVKELAKRWAPDVFKNIKKTSKHQALADIYDSIEELKYYKEHFFKIPKHVKKET